MRGKVSSTLLAVLVLALSVGLPAQRGGADPAEPGLWGVVIGIDHYNGTAQDLQSARADAGDMVQALDRFGVPADHRLVLMDGAASGAAIRAAGDWLVAHSTEGTTAVFFFAGHVEKLSSSTEAMRGADGALVTDRDMAGHLSRLHARSTWITIAGCFGGGFDELLGPGRTLTAASDANHLSYENEDFGRSYLGEYMIRRAMVLGQADSSVQAAFQYAAAAIRRDYPNRVPVEYDQSGGPIDLRASATPIEQETPDTEAPRSRPTPAPAPAVGSGQRIGAAAPPTTSGAALTGETLSAAALEPAEPGMTGADATDLPGSANAAGPTVAAPDAPPISALTNAIDRVAQLRARLISWLSAKPAAASG